MKKLTQKEIILNQLIRKGSVNNASAFTGKYNNRNILRLGALIHDLRQEGFDITTNYQNKKGFRNTIYTITPNAYYYQYKKKNKK